MLRLKLFLALSGYDDVVPGFLVHRWRVDPDNSSQGSTLPRQIIFIEGNFREIMP